MRLNTKQMRVLRAEKELSQENVARMAEISQNHYSNVERGRCIPRLEVLWRISKILGCSVTDLIVEKGEIKNE